VIPGWRGARESRTVFRSTFLGILALALPGLQGGNGWEGLPAPDGDPGLEARGKLSEVLALVRSRRKEDEEFLARLEALSGSLQILGDSTEGLYRSRGLFQVLEPTEAGCLAGFHARLAEMQSAPEAFLALPGEKGRLWTKILCDTRIAIRSELFYGWEEDAREIRSGLALLRANASDWVRLSEEEGALVARRVDLAAALLRARIKDLSALRETPGGSSEVDEAEVGKILSALELPEPERGARLAVGFARIEERSYAMWELLFLARLSEEARVRILWREELDQRARELRIVALRSCPDTEEGRAAPREIRIQKKTTRRREAFDRAVEGLAQDPFDPELALLAGRMAEYVRGTYDAVDYFDRFLALRGIQVHDDRTWRKRELTPDESYALFQIQQFESGTGTAGFEEGAGSAE